MNDVRKTVASYLDPHGDVVPPWDMYPHYDRHSLGWRMGSGQEYFGVWSAFLKDLDPLYDARLAYLRRHAPAPLTWAGRVYTVLYPHDKAGAENTWDEKTRRARIDEVSNRGLAASDIAIETWKKRFPSYVPWGDFEKPEHVARYDTREFWFWSRTQGQKNVKLPESWALSLLPDGSKSDFDPTKGLLTLAQMLVSGRVLAPWDLGQRLENFDDAFDEQMGFVDAYRLWAMTCFDDATQRNRFVPPSSVPAEWKTWFDSQIAVD